MKIRYPVPSSMFPIRQQLIFVGAILLQVQLYVREWITFLRLPATTYLDFLSFYTAGRVFQSTGLSTLYDLDVQYAIQNSIRAGMFRHGGILPFIHPPFLVPILGLITTGDYRVSYMRWCLILLIVLALCCAVVFYLLAEQGWDKPTRVITAVASVLFYPVYTSVLMGHDTPFMLLGALVWMWALINHRDTIAGAALAMVMLKPQIALVIAIPHIVAGRWRVWWSFCAASSVLTLYSIWLVGWQGARDFVDLMLLSAKGEGYGINQVEMYNFIGLVLRNTPMIMLSAVRILTWIFWVLSVAVLCWLWQRRSHSLGFREIGLAVIVSLFASPHLHSHDLSLLLLPLLAALVLITNRDALSRKGAAFVTLYISFLLLVSDGTILRHLIVYALMAALTYSLYTVDQTKHTAFSKRPSK